jgi:hypothetical protein
MKTVKKLFRTKTVANHKIEVQNSDERQFTEGMSQFPVLLRLRIGTLLQSASKTNHTSQEYLDKSGLP